MPRLTSIYTRTGDDGSTALGGRSRVGKDDSRVCAYGEVDELNAAIGVVLAAGPTERIRGALQGIQNELFHLGADLAFPEADKARTPVPGIEQRHVERLEQVIDELSAVVGPLENFILPGGAVTAAHLQVARAICRRAERAAVHLARQEVVGSFVLAYLNRLSDALFVMARVENRLQGVEEPLWDSRA
jgi:cob(I)alamin adenosyltransferase